jgi:tetratricopeptide (TPR) repeat protein
MSKDNADELRKALQKLSQVKDKVDFLATTGLIQLLEQGTTPVPRDTGSLLKEIYERLPTTDSHLFLRYGKAVIARVYPHIADTRLREAIKEVADAICRRRIKNNDLKAVRSVHLGIMEEALSATPPPNESCLSYFLSIWSDFQDNDDTEDHDIVFPAAIAIFRELNGEVHPETADCYEFRGHALHDSGYLEEAFENFSKAKDILDELVKTNDEKRFSLINVMLSMCDVARKGQFPERTADMFESLKQMAENEEFVEPKQYSEFYEQLAKGSMDDEDEAEAINWYRKCLETLRDITGEGSRLASASLHRQRAALALARIYSGLNEPQLVEQHYIEAVSVADHISNAHADEVADNLYYIASFFSKKRDFARAQELLEKALHLKQQTARHTYVEQELIERELATVRKQAQEEVAQTTKPLESLLGEIEQMIGLSELKKAMREHGVYLDYLRLRRERGMRGDKQPVLHAVFSGNPGTGKTTVAKLLGQVYHRLELLSSGHVHTVVRANLVGHLYGSGEQLAREALAAAKGGVLFIDEAYTLARRYHDGEIDQRDPGMEVIETLMPVMSDLDSDVAIVVAGYPQEMQRFLDSNPGFKSRFKLFFNFPDYTPPEMLDIALCAARRQDIELSDDAQGADRGHRGQLQEARQIIRQRSLCKQPGR